VGLLMIAMRSQSTPAHEHGLAHLAAQQFGVVSRGQLHALGFANGAIQRNVAAGRLHRRHRGVYAVGHTVIGRHGAYLAAVLACGPGAVLSYRSAAALWGLRPSDASRIDVTVPHTCGVRTSAAIVVHRSRRPVKATTHDGIPVTTPGQTLADLATALPRRALEKVAEAAEAKRLHVEVDVAHPGAKRLGEVLAAHDLDTTTRSGLEDAFLALCDAHGIRRRSAGG
jgi:predicted transcriptional regulator of viral defense system